MRSENDLTSIQFELVGVITIDTESLDEDPIWRILLDRFADDEQTALEEYVSYYLDQQRLLDMMPSTTGPAIVLGRVSKLVIKTPQ